MEITDSHALVDHVALDFAAQILDLKAVGCFHLIGIAFSVAVMTLTDLGGASTGRNPDLAAASVEHHFEILDFRRIVVETVAESDFAEIGGEFLLSHDLLTQGDGLFSFHES